MFKIHLPDSTLLLISLEEIGQGRFVEGIEEIKDEIAISENASVTSQVNINPPFGSMGHLEDPRLFKNTYKPDNSARV
jgi:hypothetical protein